ncbi:MAG: TonB-dependent receptor [Pseudomonadota bacterium]
MIRKSLLLTGSLAIPFCAAAQDERTVVDEIVVSATPLNRTVDELTSPALVLTAEELLLRATTTIGETLANQPGISSSYFGPYASRPVIRGLQGPRITVLQSGIGTLDVADLSPDHAVPLEPLFAESVEVLLGPATLLYGSNAAGGVVNVVDNRIPLAPAEEAVSGAFEVRGDTATGEQTIAGRLDGGTDTFAWHIDIFDRENDDIEIDGFATADAAERPPEETTGEVLNSAGEANGYAIGGTLFGERGNIGLSISQYETTYGLAGPGEEEEEEEGEEEEAIFPGPFIDLEQTRVDLRAEYEFGGFIETAKLRLGVNDYEHSEIEPSGEVGTVFDNEATELRVEAVHAETAGWRGAFGLQYVDREFSALGAEAFVQEPVETSSLGVFIFEERETSFGRVDLGARIETLEHDYQGPLEDYDETAVSLAIGTEWKLSGATDVTFNLSRSERHPDPAELFAEGPHLATGLFEIGVVSAGFEAEKEVSTNFDVGYHLHGDSFHFRANVFYNDIADYVVLQLTGGTEDGLPETVFAQEDAELYGAEFSLDWRANQGDSPWSGRFFGDFVQGETDSDYLPRLQPARLGAEVRYGAGSWSAGAEAIFHAEQDNVSSFQTDSFTMVNADVLWNIESNQLSWDLFLRASNLLDEDARRAPSFRAAFVPLPGINFQAGVRLRFN